VASAGGGTLHWDGRDAAGMDVPAGVYFARLVRPGAAAGAAARGRIHVVR
jgi:hypothetical protein